ncbi:hypothetical protein Pan97_53040 [Bremerella volcania]|uniref:Uncharacterized protein n=1 Tax=Bremerella volcania TaxID=2527984 RepID=A0A518CG66_9BACT|nr:hypothetical protein [Bremerella volcania]QDU78220.1 hypothetical protein Pan97_53040 [Bremerella volcania]
MSLDEDHDFASVEEASLPAAQSQLTLLDIMVGVTVAAVTCGFWFQMSQSQMPMFQFAMMVPTLIIFVLGGTALFSFSRRYFLKQPIDFQPGHWLLCLMGVTFVIQSTAHLLRWAVITSDDFTVSIDQHGVMLFFLGQHAVFLIGFLLAGILLPVRPAWRLALVAPVLQNLLTILLFGNLLLENQWYLFSAIYSYANLTFNLLGIFTVLALTAWDRATTHDRRDWLHWLGVAAMLIWDLPTLIIQLSGWF